MIRAFIEALPILVELGLLVYCLIDCVQTPEESVRSLPKVVWVILILLLPIVGGIAWLLMGRPQNRSPRRTWSIANGFPESTRPRDLAPDDDPAFLRKVAEEASDHEALLKQWEADLRRREQGLRGDNEPEEPGDPR
jgi:Phospholipase_D-nuclease N-terminal